MAGLQGMVRAAVKKVSTESGPMLNKFWYYAKVELTPPSPTEIVEIKNGFQNILLGLKRGTWMKLTVKEAWLNLLVATEVGCWFYIGECIGKRHLIGYNV